MTTDWTFTPPPDPADGLEARLHLAVRALSRIVECTRSTALYTTAEQVELAHEDALRTLGQVAPAASYVADPPKPPEPEPPYRPDRDPSPWQPRTEAAA